MAFSSSAMCPANCPASEPTNLAHCCSALSGVFNQKEYGMPAYAYPIAINRCKLYVNVTKTFTLDMPLTVSAIEDKVGLDTFDIEPHPSKNQYELTVYSQRFETDKELQDRVSKEEAYMREYNTRKQKRGVK